MAEDLPATLGALLAAARARLAEAGIEDAALDARLLVEHRAGAFDRAVHGGNVALPDQQQVARRNVIERNFIQSAIAMPRGSPGHAGQKIAHLPSGATFGKGFQESAARIHQRDNGRRKSLAKYQR